MWGELEMYDRLLALPVFLPILTGIFLLLIQPWIQGGKRQAAARRVLFLLVLANSVLMGVLIMGCGGRSEPLVLFRLYGELTVMFRLDRMGSVFAGLVSFLWPLATLYAFEYMEKEPRRPTFFGFYTISFGVTLGVALAGNLVTMYLFFEMLTFATFPLVMHPMTTEAARATRLYLYYSIGGAAFAFLGLIFVLTFSATGTTAFVPGGMLDTAAVESRKDLALLLYVLAFFGFGVKAALFPFHGWLPKATVAPTPVTALLHAVAVVKSGVFAVLRLTYFSFGAALLRGTWAQWVVMAASLLTIVYASTMAVREVHWKRRLAYSTISNLSYILFGASLMSPAGFAAALTHLIAHAFMKICAFFCAGAVQAKTGKTYIYELDGLGRRMPVTFACYTISALSLMGIPLFAGFVSKWSLCEAAFSGAAEAAGVGRWLAILGVAVILYSALMTGIYMLSVTIRAFFPWKNEKADLPENAADMPAGRGDPGIRMRLPLILFAAIILAIGLYAKPILSALAAIGGEVG